MLQDLFLWDKCSVTAWDFIFGHIKTDAESHSPEGSHDLRVVPKLMSPVCYFHRLLGYTYLRNGPSQPSITFSRPPVWILQMSLM